MTANATDILAALNATFATGLFPFQFLPVLDGPGGVVSDSPAKRLSEGSGRQIPLIIGTVLDEGQSLLCYVDGEYDLCCHRDVLRSTKHPQ